MCASMRMLGFGRYENVGREHLEVMETALHADNVTVRRWFLCAFFFFFFFPVVVCFVCLFVLFWFLIGFFYEQKVVVT